MTTQSERESARRSLDDAKAAARATRSSDVRQHGRLLVLASAIQAVLFIALGLSLGLGWGRWFALLLLAVGLLVGQVLVRGFAEHPRTIVPTGLGSLDRTTLMASRVSAGAVFVAVMFAMTAQENRPAAWVFGALTAILGVIFAGTRGTYGARLARHSGPQR